jgi:hypothetical protein
LDYIQERCRSLSNWESRAERDSSGNYDTYRERQLSLYSANSETARDEMLKPSYFLKDPLHLPHQEYSLFDQSGSPLRYTPDPNDPNEVFLLFLFFFSLTTLISVQKNSRAVQGLPGNYPARYCHISR